MKLRLLARTSSLVRGAAGALLGGAGGGGRLGGGLLVLDGAPGPLDGLRQPALIHGLEQVVHGLQAEGLHGVLIVGGDEDEVRQVDAFFAQPADHAEAVEAGHVDVQKDHFRLQLADQLDGVQPIGTRCDYFHFREILEQVGELVAGQLFVVHDNCREGGCRRIAHGSWSWYYNISVFGSL